MYYFKKLKKGDGVLNTFKEKSNYLKAIALMSIFTFIFLGMEYLFVDIVSLLASENRVVLSQNYVLGMSRLGFVLFLSLGGLGGITSYKALCISRSKVFGPLRRFILMMKK